MELELDLYGDLSVVSISVLLPGKPPEKGLFYTAADSPS